MAGSALLDIAWRCLVAHICVIDRSQGNGGREVHLTSCWCLPSEKRPIARRVACRRFRTLNAYVPGMARVDVVVQSQRQLQLG